MTHLKERKEEEEKKECNHVRDLYIVTPLATIRPTSPVATRSVTER